MWRPDRLRQGHADWQHYDLAERSSAGAFAADGSLMTQAEMNDAALPAAHGIEVEGTLRLLHPLGGGGGAETQFLYTHEPIIIGVET